MTASIPPTVPKLASRPPLKQSHSRPCCKLGGAGSQVGPKRPQGSSSRPHGWVEAEAHAGEVRRGESIEVLCSASKGVA